MVSNVFQVGPDEVHTQVLLDLFISLAAKPAFYALRTQQRLGYSVSLAAHKLHKVGRGTGDYFQRLAVAGAQRLWALLPEQQQLCRERYACLLAQAVHASLYGIWMLAGRLPD
jgi:hypothetical protein